MGKTTKINCQDDDIYQSIVVLTKLLAGKEIVQDNKFIKELVKKVAENALRLNNKLSTIVIDEALEKDKETIKALKIAIKALEIVRDMDSKNNDK